MSSGSFRFEAFSLDTQDRQLRRGSETVELNGRYLDALALLVSEQGRLVPKTRFMDEIWRGVPVTDEALTQCIKTLRRQLGDDASAPRFVETVPKHGYRFIAAVAARSDAALEPVGAPALPASDPSLWQGFLLLGGAGMLGGSVAGLIGVPDAAFSAGFHLREIDPQILRAGANGGRCKDLMLPLPFKGGGRGVGVAGWV